jgi:hypothetical protein
LEITLFSCYNQSILMLQLLSWNILLPRESFQFKCCIKHLYMLQCDFSICSELILLECRMQQEEHVAAVVAAEFSL